MRIRYALKWSVSLSKILTCALTVFEGGCARCFYIGADVFRSILSHESRCVQCVQDDLVYTLRFKEGKFSGAVSAGVRA